MVNRKRIVVIAIVLLIIAFIMVLKPFITYSSIHTEYNGEITKYRFDVKGYGYFQIDNDKRWYEMHHLDCDLELGDSMVKKMDDGYIYHFRNDKLIGIYGAAFGLKYK